MQRYGHKKSRPVWGGCSKIAVKSSYGNDYGNALPVPGEAAQGIFKPH